MRTIMGRAGLMTALAALAALGATGVSSAASQSGIHQVQLNAASLAGSVKTGPRAGIVPSLSTPAHKAAAAAATCTEPDCNMSYGNGPVQHSPHVYLLLWGPNWTGSNPASMYLNNFFSGLGTTSDYWSPVTSQYTDSTGHPAFTGTVLVGLFQDTTTPPNPVTEADLAAEASAFASRAGITDIADAQVVIASQSGTCFNDGFAGSCGTLDPTGYCAWHAAVSTTLGELSYTNLPYQLDAGTDCGENFINSGSAGTYDGFSIVGGHEFAESVTDPVPSSGWIDPLDTISGGEIGDKCAWGGQVFNLKDPDGNVTLSTGTFAMQSLWSNSAGACTMGTPAPPPPPPPPPPPLNNDKISIGYVCGTTTVTWNIDITGPTKGTEVTAFYGYKGSVPTHLKNYNLAAPGDYPSYKISGYSGLGILYHIAGSGGKNLWVHATAPAKRKAC